jgi:formamidopyrimidine-DNA glycosylase
MPELPEVQALAERLEAAFARDALAHVAPLQFSALKTVAPSPDALEGRLLAQVSRRGKYVVMDFGVPRLVFHLSQGGRVDVESPPKTTRPRQAVLRLTFADRGSLLLKEFGTERKAAWWVLAPDDAGPLARLGPEPDSDEFSSFLRDSGDRRRIHTILRDQRTVAGIGRGYADDILHAARLSPHALLSSLTESQRGALLGSVRDVLAAALEVERRRIGGLPTKIGDHFTVHGRWGRPCPVCSSDLRRVSYESREITYCPGCQTGGRVLADRRMSRLLR